MILRSSGLVVTDWLQFSASLTHRSIVSSINCRRLPRILVERTDILNWVLDKLPDIKAYTVQLKCAPMKAPIVGTPYMARFSLSGLYFGWEDLRPSLGRFIYKVAMANQRKSDSDVSW